VQQHCAVEQQRACALWRDNLPLQARLIPRNRMVI